MPVAMESKNSVKEFQIMRWASSECLSNPAAAEILRNRLEALDRFDLKFMTSTFNDALIMEGRAYSCEQAYPIIAKFGRADSAIAMRLETEFRRFVALTLVQPGVMHAPSGAVDMYWHYFILHTEEYAEFCEKVWGDSNGNPKIRNHYPATDETRPAMRDAYIRTRALYEKVFGPVQPFTKDDGSEVDVWPGDEETCGDSYSGTQNCTKHTVQ
jgi:hypothetical protein